MVVFKETKFFNVLKHIVFSVLPLFPFLLFMLFSYREGKVISIFGFSIYSEGLKKSLDYFLFLSVLSIYSFYVLKVSSLLSLGEGIFFRIFEAYELMVEKILKHFNPKNFRFKNFLRLLDNVYIEFKGKGSIVDKTDHNSSFS